MLTLIRLRFIEFWGIKMWLGFGSEAFFVHVRKKKIVVFSIFICITIELLFFCAVLSTPQKQVNPLHSLRVTVSIVLYSSAMWPSTNRTNELFLSL